MSQAKTGTLNGVAWVAGGRVVAKAIAFAQFIFIGRFLGPELYSVFGVALLVLTSIELLTEQGLGVALIQRSGNIKHFYGTVWTAGAVRGFVLFLLLFVFNSQIAGALSSPASSHLIAALAYVPLIRGFESLAKVVLTREMSFRPLVSLEVISSVVSLITTLSAYANGAGVWSLVYGQIAMAITSTCGSYVLFPAFTISHIRWGRFRVLNRFGFWVMLSRYASLILTRGGDVAVTSLLTPVDLSYYQYADQFSSAATIEISRIVNRVALPFYSRKSNDPKALRTAFEDSTLMVGTVVALAGVLLSAASLPLVVLLLGREWEPASLLIPLLCAWGYSRAIGSCLSIFLMATGQPRAATSFQFLMAILFLSGVIPCARFGGAFGVSALLASIGMSVSIFRFPLIGRTLGISNPWELSKYTVIPFSAALIAFSATSLTKQFIPPEYSVLLLLHQLVVSSLYFLLTFWLLCRISKTRTFIFSSILGRVLPRTLAVQLKDKC